MAAAPAPSLWALIRALWHRSAVMFVRYAVNTVGTLVSVYLVFLVSFFGAHYLGGNTPAMGHTVSGLVVGFFLWFLVIATYSDLSWNIMREAQWGTLEQLMMTPFGFRWVSLITVIVDTVINFLLASLMLAAMILTSGRPLHIDLVTVVPLLILVVANGVGIGFAMAGLALIYKRIESLFQVLQFVFIGLIAAPVASYPLLAALPLSMPSHLIGEAMTNGTRLWQLPAGELAVATLVSAAYLALGLYVFGVMERRARLSGNLAHY